MFSTGEIEKFQQFKTNEPYWLFKKVVVTFSICGGLRCAELAETGVDSVKRDNNQYTVTFHDRHNIFTNVRPNVAYQLLEIK